MYLRPLCYGFAFNCLRVYLAIQRTRPLCMRKHNLFVFYMKPLKMTFKSVRINMKQVSYITSLLVKYFFNNSILTFISMMNTISGRLKARDIFILPYLGFYEQLKFRAQLS